MFSHLQKLEVAQATSWMELPEVSPDATLLLRPATDSNKPYMNAMLRKSGNRLRRMAKGQGINPEEIEKNRAEDRELYPLYVVAGWDGILDDRGSPVEFTRENAKAFFQAIPNWILDRIRNHASTPENFVEHEPTPDAEALAGNSESVSGSS